jgi:hypothetical protein
VLLNLEDRRGTAVNYLTNGKCVLVTRGYSGYISLCESYSSHVVVE